MGSIIAGAGRTASILLVAALTLTCALLTPGATARAEGTDAGLTIIVGFDGSGGKFPHLAWRLGAAVTQGLSDFLFEIRVLKTLPRDKVDSTLYQQIQYNRPDQYAARLFYHIRGAMIREAQKISDEAQAQGVHVVGQIHIVPGYVQQTQAGQDIDFSKVLGLVVPDIAAYLAQVNDPAVRQVVNQVFQALAHTHLYILDQGISSEIPTIQRAFAQRRATFESTSSQGTLANGIAVHHARMVFDLGNAGTGANTVRFELTGETRQLDETLPDAVRDVATSLALGLVANPDSLHLPAWCGFQIAYTHILGQPAGPGVDTVKATFGRLADYIGISQINDPDNPNLLPRIDLVLSGGFPGLHQVGQLFRPNIHLKSLSFDMGSGQFNHGSSRVSSAVTPFGISALSVDIGMQQKIVDTMNASSAEVKQKLLKDLMQSPIIERLMTTASAALLPAAAAQ